MTAVVLLLFFALVFFFLEIFLPGGFLSILGIFCILGASIVATQSFGWITGFCVFVSGSVFAFFMFFVEVKWLLRSSLTRRVQLNNQVEGSSLKKADVNAYIGKDAVAQTPLAPSGKISIDGKYFTAKSENGWVEKGETVTVVEADVFHVFVKKKATKEEPAPDPS